MFFRLLLLLFVFSISLYAVPSLAQMKEAIAKDPSLLDSDQAQMIMKEKGISKADIQKKLHADEKITKDTVLAEDIENNIEVVNHNESTENNVIVEKKTKSKSLGLRVNPFSYKTSEELRKDLQAKQQLLVRKKLQRYSDAFYANKNTINSASLVTPDNYTIAAGDILDLYIYGDRDQHQELTVGNDGTIQLEFIGPVKVGGMTYKDVQEHLKKQLKHHFKTSSFKILISKYSSIQATLIGDVKNPGIYNLSSFSTVKDLLIASKGVRSSASVRNIIVKREGKTIANIDFYDLLFGGKDIGSTLLKHGDIIIIKQAEKLVSIDGYVNNTAIFELKQGERLSKLIEYAGGMKPDASKRHIKIDRYSDNSLFETFQIPYKKAKNFAMKDGDKVYIYKLDESDAQGVNIYGNILRPGSYTLSKSGSLHQLLQTNLQDGIKKFFLPDTYFAYAVVKRYSDDLSYETKSFNLKDVISNKQDVQLLAQDEIYIFSSKDILSSSYVTTIGKNFIQAGKLQYFSGMSIKDALNASGIDGIINDKVRVTTINTKDRMPRTNYYSLKNSANIILSPYDEVEVYDYYKTHLLEPVSIKGEVINPTTVFYEKSMTLQSLFDAAGGITKMAYVNKMEIVRYYIDAKKQRAKKIMHIDLETIDPNSYKLQPYDEVTIYKIPNWNDKKTVTIKGEVKFPGTYTVSSDEKLSSVIERAGGYTKDAFVEGAVFTRESIRKQQIEQYNSSLAKIKRELALYNAMPANAKKATVGNTATLDQVVLEAKKYQPIGRVSVSLDKNITNFKNSQFDLVMQDKDTIAIPNRIDTITVFGEVFNPTSFVFDASKNVEDYLAMASGLSRSADGDHIYVIHANGISEPIDTGWFSASVEVKKGDTIVVPLYIKETSQLDLWDSVSRILASFAITAATLNTLGVF